VTRMEERGNPKIEAQLRGQHVVGFFRSGLRNFELD
jgi:hypothetical protein